MSWLDRARLVSIFAVVVLHVAGFLVVSSEVGSGAWWVGNVYDSLVRWCVPVFVMISGALLLDPAKTESMKTFYSKRLSRIAIPLLTWGLFYLAVVALRQVMQSGEIDLWALLTLLVSGTVYYHLWFLYMILGLYLLTPFLRKTVAACTKTELRVLIGVSFFLATLSAGGMLFGQAEPAVFLFWFLPYVPYFLLGYVIRRSDWTPSLPKLWAIFILSVAVTAVGCGVLSTQTDLETGLYFYHFLSVSVIPMSVSVFYLLKVHCGHLFSETVARRLAPLTLGIYLIHAFFFDVLIKAGFGPLSGHPVVTIPLISLVLFSLALGASWVIAKVPYARRTI